MAYSEAKLKNSGDRASLCFKPFLTGNMSDKFLPIRTLLTFQSDTLLLLLLAFLFYFIERMQNYKGCSGFFRNSKSLDLSCGTRCTWCFRFINRCDEKFREVILKHAFVCRALYQSFEEQFGYNSILTSRILVCIHSFHKTVTQT
jgi:hypothetical protein